MKLLILTIAALIQYVVPNPYEAIIPEDLINLSCDNE
jgi:hypothetical protein